MRVEVIAIGNEADYRAARKLVSSLRGSESPEDVKRLRAEVILVAAWEANNAPPVPPTAVEAIRFRMEQMGLKPRDMVCAFGTRSRVSEVLGRKRELSLAMIRRLHREFGIPAEVLIETEGRQRRRPMGRSRAPS